METKSLNPKGILRDLVSLTWSLPYFLNKGKKYEPLLKYLIEKNYKSERDLPQIKDLLKESGLTYLQFSKFIRNLYSDLMQDEDLNFKISKIGYCLWLRSSLGSVAMYLDSLPIIPRVGENIEIPYFHEYLGRKDFYVKKVTHRLDNDEQLVDIELVEGHYNLYWHLRLDEALEKMEVNWQDAFWLDDYKLKKKLGIIPKWYDSNP